MIRADTFVQALRRAGFALFSGTPCSCLAPLINRVIDSPEIRYVGAANEAQAVAIACGSELGGKPGVVLFQNSGLGNAVNPLTSLALTLRIPVLVVASWRGHPRNAADEPQHQLMGRITPDLLRLMDIPCEEVTTADEGLAPVLARAMAHMSERKTPYGLLVPEGTMHPYSLQTPAAFVSSDAPRAVPDATGESCRLDQDEVLAAIQAGAGTTDAVVATTGFTGRALYALDDLPNQLYMVGSMGCVSSLGLGLALGQPRRRVIVLDGDGAMLMHMGALAAIAREGPANLVHVLLDNGVHDSTGGQSVSSVANLAEVAAACGYPRVLRVSGTDDLHALLCRREPGLTFVHVKTKPRASRKLPRPEIGPAEVAERFRHWLKETCQP
jgi:phosphonopyruvate decarboxylase